MGREQTRDQVVESIDNCVRWFEAALSRTSAMQADDSELIGKYAWQLTANFTGLEFVDVATHPDFPPHISYYEYGTRIICEVGRIARTPRELIAGVTALFGELEAQYGNDIGRFVGEVIPRAANLVRPGQVDALAGIVREVVAHGAEAKLSAASFSGMLTLMESGVLESAYSEHFTR